MSFDSDNHTKQVKIKKQNEKFDHKEIESMLPEELDNLYTTMPLTKETTCGFWIFKGWLLQKYVEYFYLSFTIVRN